ncbi:hypothetical protein R1flu_017732 [Riccia fluitans]|uniref:Uncharacterized protein n=1 Tax=Riccia fluitans TaxID=41844 RepID=A0ABD1ZDU1_9MARC
MVDDCQDIEIEGRKKFGVPAQTQNLSKYQTWKRSSLELKLLQDTSKARGNTTTGNEDDDGELAADDCESRPAQDEEASRIPVGMKTTVKAKNTMDGLPEYFRLWD